MEEELIGLVTGLAQKYTGNASSSVTWERAQQLMEAVLYCIHEYERECAEAGELLPAFQKPSAESMYRKGYELVVRKVKKMNHFYTRLMKGFCDYGNRNYADTVQKGIPQFFRRYDAVFEPQNHILTLDYPLLTPMADLCGIDAIEQYLGCIRLEQRFLGAFPRDYVERVLVSQDWNYREAFYNLAGVLLRNVLFCVLAEKPLTEAPQAEHYRRLEMLVQEYGREGLQTRLETLLQKLIEEKWNGNELLYEYLGSALPEMAQELTQAEREHTMERAVPF